jgi:hypothetical protein
VQGRGNCGAEQRELRCRAEGVVVRNRGNLGAEQVQSRNLGAKYLGREFRCKAGSRAESREAQMYEALQCHAYAAGMHCFISNHNYG